jgi:hypothetical protein
MKSIAEMKKALNVRPSAKPVVKEPRPSVRDTTVAVLGATVPTVKKGLFVATSGVAKFLSDVSISYKYHEAVRNGDINPDKETDHVRTRAR